MVRGVTQTWHPTSFAELSLAAAPSASKRLVYKQMRTFINNITDQIKCYMYTYIHV